MRQILLCTLALVGLLGFAGSPAYGQGVSGTIKVVGSDAITVDAYILSITKETKIYKRDGKDRKAATFKDLKVGQRVDVRVADGFDDSKPGKGIATEIVIVGAKEPDIRGVITKVTKLKDMHGMVLVEGKMGKQDDKLWVHVTKETKIFKLGGGERKAARSEDLKAGVTIEAYGNGEMLLSDPGQIFGVEIVILPAKKK